MTIEAELDATVASAVGPVVDEQLTGHTDRVSGVAIAPDGSWLATTSWDATVRIWDAVTREAAAEMAVDGPLQAVCCQPQGHGVFVGGTRGVYGFAVDRP